MPVISRNSLINPLRQGLLDQFAGYTCWDICISVKAFSLPSTWRIPMSAPQGRQPKATHSVMFPPSHSKSVLSSAPCNQPADQ